MKEFVILVDENDTEIGSCEKLECHEKALLHRAFSILVFNSKNEIMLQQRAKSKYHCGGVWSNTCCGHPRPGESIEAAAKRRLMEEMGFECPLSEIKTFIYKIKFDNGLTEHEFLHVFKGLFDGVPVPNPEEADSWKWIAMGELKKDIKENPDKYSYWFKLILEKL
ncbi:isopentenyl-diphosphate Delta-isomerase [Candidatus Woesearchaeota archaeon]|nr:isopentenyl-diphosphate Delta-isomerase [Candidatus Woesearchaeota archaeon]MBW3016024.1 isopentenyl-diphosphate Delta-isomerase [Candidatus Woesearchaeota archaeon]